MLSVTRPCPTDILQNSLNCSVCFNERNIASVETVMYRSPANISIQFADDAGTIENESAHF